MVVTHVAMTTTLYLLPTGQQAIASVWEITLQQLERKQT